MVVITGHACLRGRKAFIRGVDGSQPIATLPARAGGGGRYPNLILLLPSVSFWRLCLAKFNWKIDEVQPPGAQVGKDEKSIYRSKQKITAEQETMSAHRCTSRKQKAWWRTLHPLKVLEVRKGIAHIWPLSSVRPLSAGPP